MTRLIKKLSEPKILLFLGVLYTAFVSVAFLSPVIEIPPSNIPFPDKLAHVIIHSVLFFIWLSYGVVYDKSHNRIKIVFVILIACLIYGAGIEVLQHYFIKSRAFDLYDIFANEIGGLIGLLFYWIVTRK
jgi:VanZ family protein